MAILCPQCKRVIASYNFKYCLYCSASFDTEMLQELEKEKSEAVNKSFDKDFLEWKYQSTTEKIPGTRIAQFLKLLAIVLLTMIAAGAVYAVISVFKLASSSTFAYYLMFIALPVVVAMIALIGFMVYRMFTRRK
jgi:hypothetical protein